MPLTKRQIYRRRRIAVFGGLGLFLASAFYLPFTLLAPIDAVAATDLPYSAPAHPAAELDFPSYGASGIGAVGYDGVLASSGEQKSLPIASITKVITALVVLDKKPLNVGAAGPGLTFSSTDQQYYATSVAENGLVQPVHIGQVTAERNVLDIVLMASANNYARSLAHWAFGSDQAFRDAARKWLDRNGLTATTVVDPVGIGAGNTSTVADLVHLGKLAIGNPVVAEIVATKHRTIDGVGAIDNRNKLLGVDGVTGIKTGTLPSNASLLFSAQCSVGSHTITLVGVVLGGPNHPTVDGKVRSLIAQATAGFHELALAKAGESFASYSTPWGDKSAAVAARDVSAVVWGSTPISLTVRAKAMPLASAGTAAGQAEFRIGGQRVRVPLQLSESIDDPGPWWRLTNPGELF